MGTWVGVNGELPACWPRPRHCAEGAEGWRAEVEGWVSCGSEEQGEGRLTGASPAGLPKSFHATENADIFAVLARRLFFALFSKDS